MERDLELEELLKKMWDDYVLITPLASQIHGLLEKNDKVIINDHVALRTFSHPLVGIEAMAESFKKLGYVEGGQYDFEVKKLTAKHYIHPDEGRPKIFISQLELDRCSKKIQKFAEDCLGSISRKTTQSMDFCLSGRPWPMDYSTYQDLKTESEYAAWLGAFGFRVNHFTVSVNHLSAFKTLEQLNYFLKENGIALNDSGGEIKGSEDDCLEQSSTLASESEVKFSDGVQVIPSCYYEFAKRYPDKDGRLFQGFVAKSADKIFESTDRSQ